MILLVECQFTVINCVNNKKRCFLNCQFCPTISQNLKIITNEMQRPGYGSYFYMNLSFFCFQCQEHCTWIRRKVKYATIF